MEIRLKLGKMTGKEIADWLGISYNSTYRNNPGKQIKKLDGYCVYQRIRGGVEVSKIYTYTYHGEISKKITKDFMNEIESHDNKLSSIAGIQRKFQQEKEEYQEISPNTVYSQLTETAEVCFGKTNYTAYRQCEGAFGARWGVWVIKISDYNEYRYLTFEENKIFDDIISCYYGKDPKKVKQLAMLEKAFRKNEISKEEFFSKKDELDLDFFGQCIQRFKDKTGFMIARCQVYEIDDHELKSAF